MYLGTYRFEGDPTELVAGYDQLMAALDVRGFELHVCAVDTSGISVVHGCPTEAIFREFETSDAWASACLGAGLPAPTVAHHGEVHEAQLRQPMLR